MLAMGDSALRKEADAMTFVGCDHLIPTRERRLRDSDAERPGSLEVDDELARFHSDAHSRLVTSIPAHPEKLVSEP